MYHLPSSNSPLTSHPPAEKGHHEQLTLPPPKEQRQHEAPPAVSAQLQHLATPNHAVSVQKL